MSWLLASSLCLVVCVPRFPQKRALFRRLAIIGLRLSGLSPARTWAHALATEGEREQGDKRGADHHATGKQLNYLRHVKSRHARVPQGGGQEYR
jgi:hypothetical protein